MKLFLSSMNVTWITCLMIILSGAMASRRSSRGSSSRRQEKSMIDIALQKFNQKREKSFRVEDMRLASDSLGASSVTGYYYYTRATENSESSSCSDTQFITAGYPIDECIAIEGRTLSMYISCDFTAGTLCYAMNYMMTIDILFFFVVAHCRNCDSYSIS